MKAQKRNESIPQTCVVCGNAATGFHYQVAACNRCKAFFRRAILSMKIIEPCDEGGDCMQRELKTGDLCRSCRFTRCVQQGMNPLCIESPIPTDENPIVQQALKMQQEHQRSSEITSVEVAPKPLELAVTQLIEELKFIEIAHEKIRRSQYSPVPEDLIPLATLIQGHSKLACVYEELPSGSTVDPFSPVTGTRCYGAEADALWRCTESNHSSPSTLRKWSCLKEFCKVWPHADLVYAIEYMKTFQVFHQLNYAEKRQLVRRVAAICAHLTVAYFSYKMKSSVTFHPYSEHEMRSSIERLRALEMDEKEYVLLKAIIVCDSTIVGISDYSRTILEDQRARYSKALLTYMIVMRGAHQAPAQLLEMISLVDWFRSVNQRRKEHHLLRTMIGLRPRCCSKESKETPFLQDEIFL